MKKTQERFFIRPGAALRRTMVEEHLKAQQQDAVGAENLAGNLNSPAENFKPSAANPRKSTAQPKKLTLADMWKKAPTKKPRVDAAAVVVEVLDDDEAADLTAANQQKGEREAGAEVAAVETVAVAVAVAVDATPVVASAVPGTATTAAKTKARKTTASKPRKWSSKKVDVVRLGTLHARPGWFNSNYIFPVGYHTQTSFRSSVDLNEHVVHDCQIIGEGGQFWPKPTFRVTASDRPEEPLDGKSATACWTAVQKRINAEIEGRRARGEDLPPPPKTAIAGTEYFGFGNAGICGEVERLDVDRACVSYWEGKEAREDVYRDHGAVLVDVVDAVASGKGPAVSVDGGSAVTEDVEDVCDGDGEVADGGRAEDGGVGKGRGEAETETEVGVEVETADESAALKEMMDVMVEGIASAMEAEAGAEAGAKAGADGDVVMAEVEVLDGTTHEKETVPVMDPAGDKASPTTASAKKRRTFSFDPATVTAMEALYAKNSLPSKADKMKLAEEFGIEVKQIESWMGKRRKADKDAEAGIVKPAKKAKKVEAGVVAATQADAAHASRTQAETTQVTTEGTGAAAAVTQQTPATTTQKPQKPPRVPLSDEVLQAKVGATRLELEAESTALKERGLFAPLVDLATLAGADPTPFSDDRLCYLAAGQRLTLTELINTVSPMFEDATRPTEDAMRASLVLMLERKSADPVNKTVKALDRLDWKNADGLLGGGMWQWEAKNKENLDKDSGNRAVAIKKRHAKVQERLKAIANLLSLAESDASDKADKVDRAVAAFAKSSSMAALDAEVENARKQEKLKEDFERLKADKKQEKERMKAEKEAEKERLKAEKAAEKSQKEQKKAAEKTGFKDSKTLEKSANMFKSFLNMGAKKTKADRTAEADGDGADASAKDAKDSRTYYERRFLKPTPASVRAAPVQVSLDAALASAGTSSHEDLVSEFRASMKAAGAKYVAEQTDLKQRCLGLPPSWARKADAIEVAEQSMHQLSSNGLTPGNIQTYRRKFIYVKDPYTVRPPFYGSKKPLEGGAVGPRRFFGKDPSLDYEVMSDEDWEEEPEGSSLSQDDAMSEEDEADAGEEDDNSFCVGDGYLSADEGIKSDDDGVIAMDEADLCLIKSSKGDGSKGRPDLAPYLEKSRRSGKPFVLVRDSVTAEANHGACYRGDTALCASLEMEVLLPGARVEVPDLDEDKLRAAYTKEKKPKALSAQAGAEDKAEKKEKKEKKEKPTYDDLLPDLAAYILANASATKPQLIDGFILRHPDRQLTKRWVDKSISGLATRSGKSWKLKPSAATQGLPDGGVTPMCTIRVPTTVQAQAKPAVGSAPVGDPS